MSRFPTLPLVPARVLRSTSQTRSTRALFAAVAVLWGLCAAQASAAVGCEAGVPLGEVLEVRTTAYTHSEATHLKYGARNAVGEPLRYGKVRSAAADWSKFPLGTRFRISGSPEIYEVDDYGSALVGKNTIDLYKPSPQSMRQWGVREVEIEVLEWGTFERSLEVLVPRMRNAPHVAAMVRGIRAKAKGQGSLAESAPAAGHPTGGSLDTRVAAQSLAGT